MSNEVYTTAQAAETLGITANNLRVLKSRKADQLNEGTHWVTGDNNQILWTQAGIDVLQQLKTGNDPITSDVMTPLQEPLQEPATDDPLGRYNPLVESVAQAITSGLLGRIDKAVTRNIKQAIAKPMTSTECVNVLTELGLKPCNPELLLSGNQTNLLTESKDN